MLDRYLFGRSWLCSGRGSGSLWAMLHQHSQQMLPKVPRAFRKVPQLPRKRAELSIINNRRGLCRPHPAYRQEGNNQLGIAASSLRGRPLDLHPVDWQAGLLGGTDLFSDGNAVSLRNILQVVIKQECTSHFDKVATGPFVVPQTQGVVIGPGEDAHARLWSGGRR